MEPLPEAIDRMSAHKMDGWAGRALQSNEPLPPQTQAKLLLWIAQHLAQVEKKLEKLK